MKRSNLNKMIITAVLLAVGYILPFFLGQVQILGKAISPLHIPVLICGLTCGWPWGLAIGIILPILRSLLAGMPPMVPVALAMAFEMGIYGLLTGLLYPVFARRMKNHVPAILVSMIVAMIAGRIVGGAAQAVILGLTGKSYSFNTFVTAYFVNTAVGAVLHLIVVPVIVLALEGARLSPLAAEIKA